MKCKRLFTLLTGFRSVRNGVYNKKIRAVFILMFGTAGAQILSMAITPIITRIYSPTEFGIYSVFLSFVAVLMSVSSGGYALAIALPKFQKEALFLIQASFLISLFLSLLCSVTFVAVYCYFFDRADSSTILGFFVVFFVCIGTCAQMCVTQWNVRAREYKLRASSVMLASIIANSIKVSLGIFFPYAASLMGGQTAGIFSQVYWARKGSFPKVKCVLSGLSWSKIVFVLGKYSDFPLYRAPQVLVNAVGQNAIIFLFPVILGVKYAGLYSLARTILAAPSMLIGQAVSDVLFPDLNEIKMKKASGRPLLRKAYFLLFWVGFIPYATIFLYGESLFGLIFGSNWEEAGKYAEWMSLWLWAMLITRPAVAAIPIMKLQKGFLIFEMFSFLVRVGGVLLSYYFWRDDYLCIVVFSLCSAALCIFLGGYVYFKS